MLASANHPLQRLAVLFGASAIPGYKSTSQQVLYGARVGVPEDTRSQAKKEPETIKALLSLFDDDRNVVNP